MECGSLAEWVSGIVTFLAVLVALVLALFGEPLRRLVQRRGGTVIADDSQIDQGNQLKTRLKIKNNMSLSEPFKVYVTEIVGRTEFIEVPLVWMHGFAATEQPTTTKEIGAQDSEWVDFLTVWPDKGYRDKEGVFLALDVGSGAGVASLELLGEARTELVLRIRPRYGKSMNYKVTVEWDGKYSHPKVSYTKTEAGS